MKDIKNYRKRSCALVHSLIESDDGFLEKVLELWALGNKIYTEAWNTEFHVFGVISSETDYMPVGKVRQKCSERFLQQSDDELKDIIESYKSELDEAYKSVLGIHGDA